MSEETIDYKKLYNDCHVLLAREKEKNEQLQTENNAFRTDPSKRGYFSLSRIINLQIDALNDFNIKSYIGGKKSEDATFERMQGLWNGLADMITRLTDLKIVLKISPDDEKQNTKTNSFTSPESIANVLGNTAGQRPQRTGA
jgi:hypothetical protein